MPTPDIDWPRLWLEAVGSALSAIVGVVVGIWRWGRNSALAEQQVRNDYIARIESMKVTLHAAEVAHDRRIDDLVDQFKETFVGIRRQFDDGRLYTEQNFVRKDDFREMREEIRDDMRDIKVSLNELRNRKQG